MQGGNLSAENLIGCAQYLSDRRAAHQTLEDRKRAMSTLYYALFHELATCCADMIAGPRSGPHSAEAWKQCFRALEHGHSKKQCALVAGMVFPKSIKDFANQYATLQVKRHRADYSPDANVTRIDVRRAIASTRSAIDELRSASDADKRAFCALVLLKKRAD